MRCIQVVECGCNCLRANTIRLDLSELDRIAYIRVAVGAIGFGLGYITGSVIWRDFDFAKLRGAQNKEP